MALRCPTCKNMIPAGADSYKPFCSDRCRLLDLGKWMTGQYVIAGEKLSDQAEPGESSGDTEDLFQKSKSPLKK